MTIKMTIKLYGKSATTDNVSPDENRKRAIERRSKF